MVEIKEGRNGIEREREEEERIMLSQWACLYKFQFLFVYFSSIPPSVLLFLWSEVEFVNSFWSERGFVAFGSLYWPVSSQTPWTKREWPRWSVFLGHLRRGVLCFNPALNYEIFSSSLSETKDKSVHWLVQTKVDFFVWTMFSSTFMYF